jgi:hypothetical protein
MNRRRVSWFLGSLAVVFIPFLLWQFSGLANSRRLATENFPLVRIGMIQDEVEELLGGPPGYYGKPRRDMTLSLIVGSRCGGVTHLWEDDSNRIAVDFDVNGRVFRCDRQHFPPEPLFDWLWRAPKHLLRGEWPVRQ